MELKCYRCGSTQVAKVIPAKAAFLPEWKAEIAAGRAVAACGCGGTAGAQVKRCLSCGFEWDYYYERAMELEALEDAKKSGGPEAVHSGPDKEKRQK